MKAHQRIHSESVTLPPHETVRPQRIIVSATTLPELIENQGAYAERCDALRTASVLALDTEFMRVSTYSPVLCLVQIFDGKEAVCVDALQIDSLTPLLDSLDSNPAPTLWHSARQDLETFYVSAARLPQRLYDTQVAAALTGPDDQLSYAQLVKNVTGVELPKTQTRTNWAKRPLTDSQLSYAADDVRYLPQVRDHLDEALDRLGRRDWFESDCARLLEPSLYAPDVKGAHRRCKTRRHLSDEQRGALRALCQLREEIAIERDKPRKWIIEDAGIEALATLDVASADAIRRVLRKSRAHRAVRIDEIEETLQNAEPVPDDRPGRPSARETALIKKAMDALRETASELDMAPGYLGARRDVEKMVRGNRGVPLLSGWRRHVIGDALLSIIEAD